MGGGEGRDLPPPREIESIPASPHRPERYLYYYSLRRNIIILSKYYNMAKNKQKVATIILLMAGSNATELKSKSTE